MTNTHRWRMQLISALHVWCTDLTEAALSDLTTSKREKRLQNVIEVAEIS